MSALNFYDHVGPFRNVPEDLRRRTAAHANTAAAAAVGAAIRDARGMGEDAHEHQAFFVGPEAVSALDKKFYEDAVLSRRSARTDFWLGLFLCILCIVPAGISAIVGVVCLVGRGINEPIAWITAAVMGAIAALVWNAMISSAMKALRDIRKQGYMDDDLPKAAAHITGKCWLPGTKALYIADTYHGGKISVRTVFYDAIGRAASRAEHGTEYVELTSRDGSVIDRISWPFGHQTSSAPTVADFITDRMVNPLFEAPAA